MLGLVNLIKKVRKKKSKINKIINLCVWNQDIWK